MLLELNIKNFAIIDDLKITFTKGLNLLTGETGAGKSIIIEALGIILGGRGTKDLIRSKEDKAVLQALFFMENLDIIQPILEEYGIDVEEDKLLIITREISLKSPSISRINGQTVTLSILRKISSNLVDIFAQQEHQSLLDVNNHKILIDSFGDSEFKQLKIEIKSLYDKYLKEKRKLNEIDTDPREREREIDLLKFQIDEIDLAKLNEIDNEQLENEFSRLSNVKEIGYSVGNIIESLSDSQYDGNSVLDSVNRGIVVLSNLVKYDKSLELYLKRLKENYFELQDLNNEFINYMETIEFNEEKLLLLTEKLDQVNRLKKKYGNSISAIIEYRNKMDNDLSRLLNHEKEIELIKKELSKIEKQLYSLSFDLRDKRKKISKFLEDSISQELMELNMENVVFKVSFKERDQLSADGIDNIEFLISTNLGEELKPVSKIVSGGEMSRIMLGFKSILAKYDRIPTMVFDEIDTGISGRTAQVVGEKISNISKGHQIISITHLPQIAAFADSHYLIVKDLKDGKAITNIFRLNEKERINEMARLLGGVNITKTTINHAKEMISMSGKLKK